MDYSTVMRCYLEIRDGGYYCDDVCGNLIGEFVGSEELSPQESKLLIEALNKWQKGNTECKSEQIKLLWDVLSKKEGFRLEFAKFSCHCLFGGSKNDF
ncbi:MAG: hypothetical protein BWY26_01100 [Elusimicrobia bacterium ADurb.Bin231]|nr:MAG: hypothetical protein BWY26_01100 [Elusimicrobia bacterium ADurb.Bin231]